MLLAVHDLIEYLEPSLKYMDYLHNWRSLSYKLYAVVLVNIMIQIVESLSIDIKAILI